MKSTYRGVLYFLCSIALAVFISPALSVSAQEEKSVIRVGISNQGFSTYEYDNAQFSSPDEILVTDMASNAQHKVKPSQIINVEIEDSLYKITTDEEVIIEKAKGPVVLAPKEKIAIEGLNRKGLPAYYKGVIELKTAKNGKFNIINVLDLETYLKGVVPNEMPISFGLEALKAQAVAARNYANRPQNVYKNYDICDSTACQVYYGANAQRDISDRAVDETRGIFALYNNEPILALYHSTAGGITEDWGNVYGSGSHNDKPYLRSIVDDPRQKFLFSEKDVRDFYSNKALSYDIKSPRYRWTVEWERAELEEVLNKTLLEQSRAGLVEPKFDGSYTLEGLKDIKVTRRGNSGKALEIEIVFKNGNFKVRKELGIRRVLKKNNSMLSSANFYIDKVMSEKPAQADEEKEEQEPVFSFEKLTAPIKTAAGASADKFILTGGGFGHGVGMSQYGAGYMASCGAKFDTILKHYYSDITLGTMKKEVFYNPYGIEYKSEFYYSKALGKKYLLRVANPKHIASLNFMINSYSFNPDMRNYVSANLGMDITKYLREGRNTVVFKPLDERDKNKSVVFQIEIRN